ncbi:S-adenosyl-L-methionine-dependent methyltransferases superfamily protein [Euphorbia peplus]|nr:S-adenosyl-L-methionine-dependent methyltransferases superfamily protein [Euphorbia peplus]
MEVSQILHMNGGEGDHSYYNNSLFQKKVILTIKPILETSIEQLCESFWSEKCLKMVDMGCSSGPNTLLPLWEIVQTMDYKFNKNPPMLQFFLNDLPGNDFNTIFTSLLPDFYQKLKTEKGNKFKNCFVAAMPGSFYQSLFPPNSLHFVFSSYSLHWCSQVPYGLVSKSGIPLNNGNICIDKSSPKRVQKAYLNQFKRDLMNFLRSRSEEMVSGGHIVLTFMAKSDQNPNCKYGCEVWQLMGNALKDMVDEGILEQQILDDYNVPLYAPSAEEVRKVVGEEGSFIITRVEEFELSWDTNIGEGNNEFVFDIWERGKYVANYMRAVAEPILSTHFGEAILHNLFHRLSSKVVHCLENQSGVFNNVTFSMIREIKNMKK